MIFSDISQPLLDRCRSAAELAGVLDSVGFVQASADGLSPIADRTVDVVTTRSVLIYVDRKDVAFREFHRVLRPGGRLSLFEPINRYFEAPEDDFWGFDASSKEPNNRPPSTTVASSAKKADFSSSRPRERLPRVHRRLRGPRALHSSISRPHQDSIPMRTQVASERTTPRRPPCPEPIRKRWSDRQPHWSARTGPRPGCKAPPRPWSTLHTSSP